MPRAAIHKNMPDWKSDNAAYQKRWRKLKASARRKAGLVARVARRIAVSRPTPGKYYDIFGFTADCGHKTPVLGSGV